MGKKLLEVKDLHTSFFTANGEVKSVNGVSYYIDEHEIVAVVGESGCGKSVTQMSVMQLVQSPPGKIKSGEVLLEEKTCWNMAHARKRCRLCVEPRLL